MAKMVFASRLNKPVTVSAPSGSPNQQIFQERIDSKTGKLVPDVIGLRPTWELIQKAREGTEIYAMLDAYWATDDETILNQQIGAYGDFTLLPKSLAEAQQYMIDCRAQFERLPREFRQSCDNDVNVFLHRLADGSIAPDVAKFVKAKYDKATAGSVQKVDGSKSAAAREELKSE